MKKPPDKARLSIRIVFDENRGMLGPGKADLLALIEETGSIAAAGRRLGMSYKRAWSLVETLNTMFAEPLVARSRGGANHGGAQLTPTGQRVLALYRTVSTKAGDATASHLHSLERLLTKGQLDAARRK